MGDKMNMEQKLIDFLKQFLLIILYIFLSLFLETLFYKNIMSSNFLLSNLSFLAIELIILTVFIFIYRRKIVPDFTDFKKNYKTYLKENYKYWLYGLLVMLISNLIISSFAGMPSNEEANRELLSKYPIYMTISILFIGPITEELLTRAPLKDTFKNKNIYIILSGLIFGSLHLISSLESHNLIEILYIIPYGALGCSLAKIYANSNNIWTNISFHAIHNFISLTLILVGALL